MSGVGSVMKALNPKPPIIPLVLSEFLILKAKYEELTPKGVEDVLDKIVSFKV